MPDRAHNSCKYSPESNPSMSLGRARNMFKAVVNSGNGKRERIVDFGPSSKPRRYLVVEMWISFSLQ